MRERERGTEIDDDDSGAVATAYPTTIARFDLLLLPPRGVRRKRDGARDAATTGHEYHDLLVVTVGTGAGDLPREGRRLARCCASTIGWQYHNRNAKRWTKPAQSKLTSKQNESDPNLHRILRRGRRRRQLDDEDHPPRNTAGSRIDPL